MTTYITVTPGIMSGIPVMRGTRIPLSRIVYLLSQGHTIDSISELYPHVEKRILRGAISELITGIDDKRYEASSI